MSLLPVDPEEGFGGKDQDAPASGGRWISAGLIFLATLAVWGGVAALILIERKDAVAPIPAVGDRYPGSEAEAVESARKAWERYVEAPSFGSRLTEVRDPERVAPMMEDHHLVRGHPFHTMAEISPGKPVSLGERRLVFFQVKGLDGSVYPVALEWDGERFRVDWESLSAYGTMDWAELVESRPEQTQTMRVYLCALADRFEPPLVAGDGWEFFRMEHRDSPDTVVVAASGQTAMEIAALVSGRRAPATAMVRWNGEIGQFEVTRLSSRSWSP